MYHGKPIFYSLGNFIAQNALVYKLPSDAYAPFHAGPSRTPSDAFKTRNDDGRKGFPADRRYWQTVVPICVFSDDGLEGVELTPGYSGLWVARPAARPASPGDRR